MAFFDKISKTVYTDAIQNIGWQPYTCLRGDRYYFSYKEKAKTTPVRKNGKVCDHKGNEFSNQKEMLRHYEVSQSQFFWRRKRGWSLERCLAPPRQKRI